MDCIDCHNRPTHVYLPANQAVNNKILSGDLPRDLPFIKKQVMEAVQKVYASQDEARTGIASELNTWYRKSYPDLVKQDSAKLEKAIAAAQAAYAENVFPEMNIQWGTYTNHIGHNEDIGCFRCHDEEHVAESGETISMDCDTCHTILAEGEANPEILKTLGGI
jgi:hypothetical protein